MRGQCLIASPLPLIVIGPVGVSVRLVSAAPSQRPSRTTVLTDTISLHKDSNWRKYIFHEITSLAFPSGMVLSAFAAPWYPPAPLTHYVNVSNAHTAGLYDPPFINAAPGDNLDDNSLFSSLFLCEK